MYIQVKKVSFSFVILIASLMTPNIVISSIDSLKPKTTKEWKDLGYNVTQNIVDKEKLSMWTACAERDNIPLYKIKRDKLFLSNHKALFLQKYVIINKINKNNEDYVMVFEISKACDVSNKKYEDELNEFKKNKNFLRDPFYVIKCSDLLLRNEPLNIEGENVYVKGFLGGFVNNMLSEKKEIFGTWSSTWEYYDDNNSGIIENVPLDKIAEDIHKNYRIPYIYVYKKKKINNQKYYLVGKKSELELGNFKNEEENRKEALKSYGWVCYNNVVEWGSAMAFSPVRKNSKGKIIPYKIFQKHEDLKSWIKNSYKIENLNDDFKILAEINNSKKYFSKEFCDVLLNPPGYWPNPTEKDKQADEANNWYHAYVGHQYPFRYRKEGFKGEFSLEQLNRAWAVNRKTFEKLKIFFLIDCSRSMNNLKKGVITSISQILNDIVESKSLLINFAVYRNFKDDLIKRQSSFKIFKISFRDINNETIQNMIKFLSKEEAFSNPGSPYYESLNNAIKLSLKQFKSNANFAKFEDITNSEDLEKSSYEVRGFHQGVLFIIGDAGDKNSIDDEVLSLINKNNVSVIGIHIPHKPLNSYDNDRWIKDLNAQKKFLKDVNDIIDKIGYKDKRITYAKIYGLNNEELIDDCITNLQECKLINILNKNSVSKISELITKVIEKISFRNKELLKKLDELYFKGELNENSIEGMPKTVERTIKKIYGNNWQEILAKKEYKLFSKGWIPVVNKIENIKSARAMIFMHSSKIDNIKKACKKLYLSLNNNNIIELVSTEISSIENLLFKPNDIFSMENGLINLEMQCEKNDDCIIYKMYHDLKMEKEFQVIDKLKLQNWAIYMYNYMDYINNNVDWELQDFIFVEKLNYNDLKEFCINHGYKIDDSFH